MPPSVSIPLAFFFYALFCLIVPRGLLPVFFAAFLLGYVWYDTIHYATHHAPMKGRLGHWLKQHHLRHHYMDDERGFGVSSLLWDFVFRTLSTRKQKPPRQS
jgi:sterol desaturase/sphingolipid hydroxylase (fatty acid hydroxylase superfamily)